MRKLKAMLIVSSLMPAPAHAMNWEGHDDWMVDMEPARILAEDMPPPARKPPRTCPPAHGVSSANPYEQIPLAHTGDCPQPDESPKPER